MRDLQSKDVAWYRFTNTPGKVYGPRDMAFVWKTYRGDPTCEVAKGGADGQPLDPWFPASELRARLASQAVQPRQIARLRELGLAVDEATLDKIEAADLIEQAERLLPATDQQLEEARRLGVTVTPGVSRAELEQLVAPILDAEAEEEDRQERIAGNADWVRELRKVGLSVDDDIDDEALFALRDQHDRYREAVAEARACGLPASKAPKGSTVEALAHATARLERWIGLTESLDSDLLEHRFQLSRPPAKKLVTELRVALFDAMDADPTLADQATAETWFLTQAAPLLGFTKRPARPSAGATRPTTAATPPEQEKGMLRWALLALVLLIVIAAFV